MKRWLVTAHDQYYPRGGTSDWRRTFADGEYDKAVKYSNELERDPNVGYSEIIDLWRWVEYQPQNSGWISSN